MAIRTPELFSRGPSPLARLVFYCALAIACIVVDYRFHQLDAFRKALTVLIYPLQEAANLPSLLIETVQQAIESPQALQAENDLLRARLLQEADSAQQFHAAETELNALRALLGLRQQQPASHAIAEVIGMARTPFAQKILISLGQNSGIQPGAPVISSEGLVGQVTAVNLFNSEVTLLTDKNQALPVMVVRNGLRAMAFGSGAPGTLSLPYVPIASDVQAGDTLVTSGIDGLYPPGLSVGQVKSVERDSSSAFAKIQCVPTGAVLRHRYVLVLSVPPRPQEGPLPNLDEQAPAETLPAKPARKPKKP